MNRESDETARLHQRIQDLEQQLNSRVPPASTGLPPAGQPDGTIPALANSPQASPQKASNGPVALAVKLTSEDTSSEWGLGTSDSTTLFRAYVETANDMVYTVDLSGRLTFVNPYGERLLECGPEEWRGKPYMDFVAPGYKETTAAAFGNLLQTGELIDYEFVLRSFKGRDCYLQVNGRLLHCDGDLIGGLGIARDITERKRFEQQLQMFQRALESTQDSATIIDLEGRILYANPATAQMFGWDEVALQKANARIFYPDDDGQRLQWLIGQAINEGWSGEVICQRQSGDRFPAAISVSSIVGEDGQPRAIVTIGRDISDRIQTQAELAAKNLELERASNLKSEFLANMSHELRTPLTAILGFSSLLRQALYGPLNEKQQVYVEQIHSSGEHLLSLINDVLDLSKVEAGQVELTVEAIDIEDLCEAAIALVERQASDRHIRIQRSFQADLDRLIADKLRVRQMILNLLSNAIKFSHEGSNIGIDAFSQAGYLHLSVWDRGIGIPEDRQDLLFQPFQQLDSSLSRRHQGTGLGLSLTKQLAELHGGSVDVVSEVGVGSRFTIQLPLDVAANPSAHIVQDEGKLPALLPVSSRPTQGPSILLVEDDADNAHWLQDLLGAWRCRVTHADRGRTALDWLGREAFDLVLLDIQLPDMDGFEVTRHIRQDDRLNGMPVVAATALAMPGDRERCLAAGMQDYLSKPLDPDRLASLLMQYTGYQLHPLQNK